MIKRISKFSNSTRKLYRLFFIATFIFILLSTASIPLSHEGESTKSLLDDSNNLIASPSSSDLFENDILYTGNQDALTINETAMHSDEAHYKIGDGTFSEYTTQNASFPIDKTHDWEAYSYNSTITNIHEERDWIENGDVGGDGGLIVGQVTLGSPVEYGPYGNNENANPSSPDGSISSTSDFMRVHFDVYDFEDGWDFLYVYDQNNLMIDNGTGEDLTDVWSPWYNATTLKFCVESDGSITEDGFSIDEYEIYNISTWKAYSSTGYPEFYSSIVGTIGGKSSIGGRIREDNDDYWSDYYTGESGFSQFLQIPRGKVVDAWFSMDYYLESGIATNDFFIFCKINGDLIYTRGFGTIASLGKQTWHSSGLINLLLWQNTSQIFDPEIYNQVLNISLGVRLGSSVSYGGYADRELQEAYFDNIQLLLKTEVNGSQSDINLRLDNLPVFDSSSWGSATFSRNYAWDTNPMNISLSTDAEKLEFDLLSAVYGYHADSTHEQDNGLSGSKLTILTNETIHWETYHNVFVPSQYNDFEFEVFKPNNWEIVGVEDPVGLPYSSYTGGDIGDSSVIIDSDFPGWWYFVANSSNRMDSSSTYLWDDNTWKLYDGGDISYDIGENIRINTSISNPSQIGNILTSWANLTVYYPNESVYFTSVDNPDGFGNIQFPDHAISALETVGGLYQYRIIWTNGTAAGGLNGTFEIKHNIQHTILYPRDAVTDFETESIIGDIIPVRMILNDSDTGIMLSTLHVEYDWPTGNDTLAEISTGIYDTSLDTLDIGLPGNYIINFTISGEGFYNIYFILNISLVAESELKIIGLDNNIDYGTNFSMRLDYHQRPVAIGITSAQISLNLSEYLVSPDATDGEYSIEINSSSSFAGPGNYDIQINVSADGFQTQELVTRIQILPRSVYFHIFIDSADCTLNKSYSAKIQQDLNFTIGVFTSYGDIQVTTGTVQLSDGVIYSDPFTFENNKHFGNISSSFFGIGVNFISLLFNETGYQSASEVLRISVTRIDLNATVQDPEGNTISTLLVDKRADFSTRIYIEDPRTHQPIENANITYSWSFGTGFLDEVEGMPGWYEFTEKAPSQTGSYPITFIINTANPDYEPQTISLTLVSQQPETPLKWWWIVIPVALVIAILSGSLIAIGVRNTRTKKRVVAIEKLKHKTQIFDDITNIKGILLIEKNSGLLMYRHVLSGLDEGNEELFSGFVRAILLLGKRFIRDEEELEKGMVFEKQEFIEFTHENFKILLAGGHKIIVALILEEQASEEIKAKVSKFIEEFEGIYASVLDGWTGNRSVFMETTPKLFEEIFNLSLLREFHLSENSEIYAKKFISPNTISERVANVLDTLHEEKETFHLKTIISLIPEEDKLAAKDAILRFIKGKYIVPKK